MLKQRVTTALALFTVFVLSLLVNVGWPFALLAFALIVAATYEWGKLNQVSIGFTVFGVLALVAVCGLLAQIWGLELWSFLPDGKNHVEKHSHEHHLGHSLAGFYIPGYVWWLTCIIWFIGAILMFAKGWQHWSTWNKNIRFVFGLVLFIAAWLAMLEAKYQGLNLLISIMALVWTADTAAFFIGRRWGHHKLAVNISPGKTWEGALAGAMCNQLLAFCWLWLDQNMAVDSPSLYGYLFQGLGFVGMVVAVAFLSAISVLGDLLESFVKRLANVKDSSQLLPGHGGVLDRLDALLPVLPMSMALLTLCHV